MSCKLPTNFIITIFFFKDTHKGDLYFNCNHRNKCSWEHNIIFAIFMYIFVALHSTDKTMIIEPQL